MSIAVKNLIGVYWMSYLNSHPESISTISYASIVVAIEPKYLNYRKFETKVITRNTLKIFNICTKRRKDQITG